MEKRRYSKIPYLAAKRKAKSEVYKARKSAQEEKFGNLRNKEQQNLLFKEARKMRGENVDIVGEKCVKDDSGNLAFDDDSKLSAWKSHYEKLLNVEFPWDAENLAEQPPNSGPPIEITRKMVEDAVVHMKAGKAAGPSGVVVEMIHTAGDPIIDSVTNLINKIIKDGVVPKEWNESYIINLYKGKGDALDRGNFRGLKLTDQVLKIMERVIEVIIRSQISIDSMQFGFMPGRTTDAIFVLRQLHEKHITKH